FLLQPCGQCLALAYLLMGGAPLADGPGEDVVKDLVSLDARGVADGRWHRSQDPSFADRELTEDAGDLCDRTVRPVGEVGWRLGDLGLRRRDEEGEQLGGESLPF